MNLEDYTKYYIQGSDHYLIPKDVFKELFNEMINWKEETIELKKQVEELSKNYNLDVPGIYITSRNDEIIRLDKKALEYLRGLEQKNYSAKTQQKEFIKYLEDEIEKKRIKSVGLKAFERNVIPLIHVLQKYKSIIGVSNEKES